MSYKPNKKLDKQSLEAISNLTSHFSDNEWAKKYISLHHLRCADDIENILSLKDVKNVLNIGGAPYIFEAIAIAKELNVVSVDLDPTRHREVIKELNLHVVSIDIEDSNARKELDLSKFDTIVLAEVLEHMRIDLIGTLGYFHDGMKPNSVLYLTTPNFFFFRVFFLNILKCRSGPSLVTEWRKLTDLGHMGHVREYSKTELIELFKYVGFEVTSTKLRNRTSRVSMTFKAFIPTALFSLLEHTFDLFAQEFIFILKK